MLNNKIIDGNTEFRVIDKRLFSILDVLYPVGRIIISNDSTAPYSDIGFGTWQEVAKGAFIEGADDTHKAGDSIEAGLPNIYGNLNVIQTDTPEYGGWVDGKLFTKGWRGTFRYGNGTSVADGGFINFNASGYNPIYGNSDTVQPKAYVSHYWLRVK